MKNRHLLDIPSTRDAWNYSFTVCDFDTIDTRIWPHPGSLLSFQLALLECASDSSLYKASLNRYISLEIHHRGIQFSSSDEGIWSPQSRRDRCCGGMSHPGMSRKERAWHFARCLCNEAFKYHPNEYLGFEGWHPTKIRSHGYSQFQNCNRQEES